MKQKLTNIKNWSIGDALRWHFQIGSAHGLRRIGYSTTYWGRLIWTILFVLALAAFVFCIFCLVLEYLGHPIKLVESEESVEAFPFPLVTICNLNPVMRSEISDIAESSLLKTLTSGTGNVGDNSVYANIRSASTAYTTLGESTRNLTSLVLYCVFNGLRCSIEQNFKWVAIDDYGLCAQFSTESELRDGESGLKVFVIADSNEDIGSIRGTTGFRVSVHDENTPPIPDVIGFSIPTGSSAYLDLTHKKISRLGSPWSQCNNAVKNSLACQSSSCDVPCEEQNYDVQYSITDWPSPGHKDTVANMLHNLYPNVNITLADVSSIRVNFDRMITYHRKEDKTIGIASFVSQIGGLSALFIGFSWITVIEIVLLLFAGCKDEEMMTEDNLPTERIDFDSSNADSGQASMPNTSRAMSAPLTRPKTTTSMYDRPVTKDMIDVNSSESGVAPRRVSTQSNIPTSSRPYTDSGDYFVGPHPTNLD